MHVVNEQQIRAEFRAAIAALASGRDIRRLTWPDGQFLRESRDGRVAVFRNRTLSAPDWHGPSVDETNASDW